MEKKKLNYIIVIIIIYFILVCLFNAIANNVNLEDIMEETTSDTFKIISSTENKDIEETLKTARNRKVFAKDLNAENLF